jgi:hypothetical protein
LKKEGDCTSLQATAMYFFKKIKIKRKKKNPKKEET